MKILLFVLLGVLNTLALADRIETIQLNHRLASEVLAEIQPFIPSTATASAANDFIILKASPEIIAEISQLINKLDVPAQSITISVFKSDQALTEDQRSQIDADITLSNHGIEGDVSIQHWSTSNSRNKDQRYQARGIAGRPITITTGESLPQQEQYLFLNGYGGIGVQTNIRYIDINNGFQAIAYILPNHQVNIEIYPQFASFSKRNGVISQSEIFTNISGDVGLWLEIGRISNDKNITQSGTTQFQTNHSQQQFIYLKVDEASR